jgi:hypothetical protein
MADPGLTTTRPIPVYIRYRRRWLKMTLPPGQSFDVAGTFWERLFSPLGTVRCMLWQSGVIADHVLSLDLPFSEWIYDVYIPIRALRSSCVPCRKSAEEPEVRPRYGLPAQFSPAPLSSIPAGQRVGSPDGSRVAGWYLASTREDRVDETSIWHIAVFDAVSHRLIRWWPHSVHSRHDTGVQTGSPIASVAFVPSDPGVLLVAHEDGTTQRLELNDGAPE